jgi:hypothetical protein
MDRDVSDGLICGRESFTTDAQYYAFREEMITAHLRGVPAHEIYCGVCTRGFYRSTIQWHQQGVRPEGNQPAVSAKGVIDIKEVLERGGRQIGACPTFINEVIKLGGVSIEFLVDEARLCEARIRNPNLRRAAKLHKSTYEKWANIIASEITNAPKKAASPYGHMGCNIACCYHACYSRSPWIR